MNEEKEKGIEELYNYLVKNKDKMSKEEYNDLKKDFENSLSKTYSEKSISKGFFENYSQKIKELEKEEIKEERPPSKKQWPLVIGLIAIICVATVIGGYFLWSEGGTSPGRIYKEDWVTIVEGDENLDTIEIVRASAPSSICSLYSFTVILDVQNNGEDRIADVSIMVGNIRHTMRKELPGNSLTQIEFVVSTNSTQDIQIKYGLHTIRTIDIIVNATTKTYTKSTTSKTTTSTPTTSKRGDDYYASLVKLTLRSHVDVYDVQVLEYGEYRSLIISYYTKAKTENEMASEIGYILGAFVGVINEGLNVNRMEVIIGEKITDAIVGSFRCETEWVRQYLRGDISMETLTTKTLMTLKVY